MYEGLGTGIRDTIRQGFDDGFDSAATSFGKLLKRLSAELLTSELIKILRNLFNPATPGSGTGATATATAGGGIFNTVTGALTGSYGGATTPSFSGGAIPGVSGSGGGAAGNGGFNLGGILQRIPGIGRIFGPRAAGAAGATGAVAKQEDFAGDLLSVSQGKTPGSWAAPSTAASLGASGLLLGGGMLGQYAGGSSATGRLLGGIGGSLGLGVLGGLGVFGTGIQAALPALFSNPITAVVAAGLIGGALLFNYFGGKDFRKFRKAVKDEYELDVKGDKSGKAVYEEIKKLGEQIYGKGKFATNMPATLHTDQAKSILGDYAEATGQGNSKLAKTLRETKELSDQFDLRNRFVRRRNGGAVDAGMRIFDAGSGPEVFVPHSNGFVFPSLEVTLNRLAANLNNKTGGGTGGRPSAEMRMQAAMFERLAVALENLESQPMGYVFVQGAKQAGKEGAQVVTEQYRANPTARRDLLRTDSL